MSVMDFEKVNLELIEALLEWIVDGKHSYPPGKPLFSGPSDAHMRHLVLGKLRVCSWVGFLSVSPL